MTPQLCEYDSNVCQRSYQLAASLLHYEERHVCQQENVRELGVLQLRDSTSSIHQQSSFVENLIGLPDLPIYIYISIVSRLRKWNPAGNSPKETEAKVGGYQGADGKERAMMKGKADIKVLLGKCLVTRGLLPHRAAGSMVGVQLPKRTKTT